MNETWPCGPDRDGRRLRVLLCCSHTLVSPSRSGVQRVVLEMARALPAWAELDYVKYDPLDGQLRFLDRRDLRTLFGPAAAPPPNRLCHRVNFRFGDVLDDPDATWLLLPEVSYHLEDGSEIFSRLVSQAHDYGLGVGAVFYDAIPLERPEPAYAMYRERHADALARLARCDLFFPISAHSGRSLAAYFQGLPGLPEAVRRELAAAIRPVSLGEGRQAAPPPPPPDESGDPRLILVGTVEPRKGQVQVLRCLNDAIAEQPELARVRVDLFGSLHPDSAREFQAELARNPRLRYHDHAPDDALDAAYAQAWASVFASCDEGYGLPIVESLRRGVPCLTADFGAMAEVAAPGGCLTVDVRDPAALRAGLVRLVGEADLRRRLRREITRRPVRTWSDYARELVGHMAGESRRWDETQATVAADIRDTLARHQAADQLRAGGTWRHQSGRLEDLRAFAPPDPDDALVLVAVTEPFAREALVPDDLDRIARAAILALPDAACRQHLIEAARTLDFDRPLPETVVTVEQPALAADLAVAATRQRRKALRVAAREKRYASLCAVTPPVADGRDELVVVVSTYNRAPFVAANVDWLLGRIEAENLPIRCLVLDNASTDDTFERLAPFRGRPGFDYHCNSANTGLLGNLRVCSAKMLARYVWITGDDDFIAPGALSRTLAAIRAHPGLPLLVHNFGIYHRASLFPWDTPKRLHDEARILAPQAAPSGVRQVRELSAEHDNLHTAFYPLVWRSDILAACFNHPFDGVFFENLLECIPTTHFLLSALARTEAYWFQEPGLAANAHNSWTRYRPRWHLHIMPRALALARDAGVDPRKLWQWTGVQRTLFDEAADIAIAAGLATHLTQPDDFVFASAFFREPVACPAGLRLDDGREDVYPG